MRRPKWLLPLFLMGFLGLAQATILHPISLWGARFQPILVVLVAWALLRGIEEGALWGFLGGLSLDFFSSAPWGAYTLALTIIGALAGLGASKVFRSNPLLPLLAVVVATLLYESAGLIILALTGGSLFFDTTLGRTLLLATLQNGLAMFFLQLAMGLLGHPFIRSRTA